MVVVEEDRGSDVVDMATGGTEEMSLQQLSASPMSPPEQQQDQHHEQQCQSTAPLTPCPPISLQESQASLDRQITRLDYLLFFAWEWDDKAANDEKEERGGEWDKQGIGTGVMFGIFFG